MKPMRPLPVSCYDAAAFACGVKQAHITPINDRQLHIARNECRFAGLSSMSGEVIEGKTMIATFFSERLLINVPFPFGVEGEDFYVAEPWYLGSDGLFHFDADDPAASDADLSRTELMPEAKSRTVVRLRWLTAVRLSDVFKDRSTLLDLGAYDIERGGWMISDNQPYDVDLWSSVLAVRRRLWERLCPTFPVEANPWVWLRRFSIMRKPDAVQASPIVDIAPEVVRKPSKSKGPWERFRRLGGKA